MSQVGLDINDLKELVTAAVKEARAPGPEELAKVEMQKKAKSQRLAAATEDWEGQNRRQLNCSHRKENGHYAVSGFVLSNNLRTQVCGFCNARFISLPGEGSPSADQELSQQPPFGPRVPVPEPTDLKAWLREQSKKTA